MAKAEPDFTIRESNWPEDAWLMKTVRYEVFVVEQSVPESLEWTGDDSSCRHVIALDSSEQPIGTGRISADGKIGRMAVLKPWRGQGIGSAMLTRLIEIGSNAGCTTITLSSQLTAIAFYRRHGFVEFGDSYQEAGIDHIKMIRTDQ